MPTKQRSSSIEKTLIDSIYNAPLEPEPWKGFVHEFRIIMNCVNGGMTFHSPQLHNPIITQMDADDGYAAMGTDFIEKYYDKSVFHRAGIKPGDIKTLRETVDWEAFQKTDYYRNYFSAYKLTDSLQFCVEEPGGLIAWISLARVEGAPLFGDYERRYCQDLIPYLERSLAMYSRLMRSQKEKGIYEDIIEHLTIGIIILDDSRTVINVNSTALRILEQMDALKLVDDQVHIDDSDINKEFHEAVARVLGREESEDRFYPKIELLNIRQGDQRNLSLLIKSVPSNHLYEGKGCPAVVICISDPSQHTTTRESYVAKVFGLTMSEASLAVLLADGLTLNEARERLNVTENTVRTVSKRIFYKTGTRRQTELVRLILRSVAVLG